MMIISLYTMIENLQIAFDHQSRYRLYVTSLEGEVILDSSLHVNLYKGLHDWHVVSLTVQYDILDDPYISIRVSDSPVCC